MSLVAYVAENGLVGHQWKESHLLLRRSYAPVQGNPGPGSRSGWVSEQGDGEWDNGVFEGEMRKGDKI